MRDAANLYRRLVFPAVVLLCAAPIEGETAHALGGLAVLGSLILYLTQGLGTLRLNISWHIGYLAIIVSEGLRQGDVIRTAVDSHAYDEASRYITAANAAVMFVRSVLYDEAEYPVRNVRPVIARDSGRLTLLISILYILFIVQELPAAISFSLVGRVNTDVVDATRSASSAISGGLFISLGILLPAMVIYYARFSKNISANIGLLLALPAMAVLFLTGIRYIVLMAAAGAFVLYVPVLKNRTVPFFRFAALGVVLYLTASTMSVFRVTGLNNTTVSSFEEYYAENVGMHAEGVVTTLAKMVDYFRTHEYMLGKSSATLLVFWIPREFWANKPTFIDHWFIRAYEGTEGFYSGFSTGSSFASDAFVDFGFVGGVIYCAIFFGVLLAILDRITARILSQNGHPYTIIIAPLFGGTLFAVRSFNTTVIQMSGVLVIGLLFSLLCDRASQSEQEHPLLDSSAGPESNSLP